MSWLVPQYNFRPMWRHCVRLKDPYEGIAELGSAIDLDAVDAIIEWTLVNSGGVRISYDTWQYKSESAAREFIVMFQLRWGT